MPKFGTVRFGELEYSPEDVITLPDGLVGLPDLQNWLILEMGDDVPLKWFQSLDRGDFGFPISQADLFHDDYEVPLGPSTRSLLGNADPADLVTLIITTIHQGGEQVTGNLLAPLLIDTNTRRGAQLTLDDDRYSLRQEINYFKFGLAVKSETTEDEVTADSAADAMCGNGEPTPEPVGV